MNSGIFVKSIDDFAGHQLEYETSDTVMVWGKTSKPLKLASGATHFGYVISGSAKLRLKDGRHYDLIQGMYFSVPNECMIEGGEGIVFSKSDFLTFSTSPFKSLTRVTYNSSFKVSTITVSLIVDSVR